ncbi:hypothetical protein [Nocardioides aurantiacus]|uniref:Uncharacterized protein n=1 Tax=Nocardioides aurantiacus TaxID=86796 RepID=A0A3N2CW63_9ACTN|nr:hypothetical protein [Nocardioides aurantiacus]ROR91729.1 hypothetical protein EDD33_2604 [Nocardioides aurantiacus]
MPDITDTLAPKSDQLDNIDLRGGEPRIFTVTGVDVRVGSDQPVSVYLAEFDRPWKPGKNMRRVIAHCWGRESDNWVGRRVELFADESVTFGKETPGGTRISRMSHIDGVQNAPILVSQGRAGTYKVSPLPDTPKPPPEPTAEEVAACVDLDALRGMWRASGPDLRKVIEVRIEDLKNEPTRDELPMDQP